MRAEYRKQLLGALVAAHAVAPKARGVRNELGWALVALQDLTASAIPELQALLDIVCAIPDLKIFDHARQHGPHTDENVDFLFLVGWLLSRAQQVGPEVSLEDLTRYLAVETIELTETLVVHGFKVPEAVAVGGFEVVPWHLVPVTDTKWRVMAHHFASRPSPMVAVTRRLDIPRLHLHPWDQPLAFVSYSIESMRDLLRCVTAASGAGVQLLDYWFEPPVWAPWNVSPIQFGVDSTSFCMPAKLAGEVLPTFRACAERFRAMDELQRHRFRLPLDRLNNSILAGTKSVDAAIDLGIALESLYIPMGLDAHIAKVLRDRASNFLAGPGKERKRIRNIVADTYDLRSLAVHAGRFDSPGAQPKWSDLQTVTNVLKKGQDVVCRSLIKMISRGEPVWPEPRTGRLRQVWQNLVSAMCRIRH